MLWTAFFMCLFMVYALSSWLTKLMASAGYSLGSALTFVLVLNFGAMIGAVGGGWLADRFHIKYVLVGMYALAAVSITLLGYKVPTEALFVLVGLAGASTIGTQIVTYAAASSSHGGTLDRHWLGFRRRPQRRHPGAHRDRHPGGHGAAAGTELHGHRDSSRHRDSRRSADRCAVCFGESSWRQDREPRSGGQRRDSGKHIPQ